MSTSHSSSSDTCQGNLQRTASIQKGNHTFIHNEISKHWDLQHRLGHGHFAEVWKGVRWKDTNSYAIKCLNTSRYEHFKNNHHYSLDIYFEPLLLERLHHPNIVSLLEWFQSSSTIFTVLKLVAAGNLKKISSTTMHSHMHRRNSSSGKY